ncbi:MAG TPA: POTRA domain-containing protein, partial [Candidatus Acidoferrales bacterium]|nr:POTRA domain-containing protein [Candidatus Acidoferrales bacterium]
PGTVVTRDDIRAGANKLSNLGWFSQVNFKFQGSAKGVEIEFTLQDAASAPLWFDNFPWFTDAELAAAIRASGLLYDGTAPETGTALDAMREALAQLLKTKNIEGDVEGEMVQAPESEGMVERFRVMKTDVRVTSLEFSDALAQTDPSITHSVDTIVGKPYSRYFLAVFLSDQVRPVYTSKGYLRVHFGEPVALFAGDPTKPLANEITLRVTIEPGVLYRWGGATWSGQVVLAGAALDGLLAMKTNEPVDAESLEAGWNRVTREYGRRGYLDVKMDRTPEYHDAEARVTYAVHITEGPQYRMGDLILTGLSLTAERKLLSNWGIPRGDVFDNNYFESFVNDGARRIFQDSTVHFTRVEHLLRPNPQTKTVDVLLNFK